MPAVPVCRGLIGVTGAHQQLLLKMTTDKLARQRSSNVREAARQCDRWAAGHVERHRVTHQGVQHLGIVAQARQLRRGRRRKTLCRHQQQVDALEQGRNTPTETGPAKNDFLIVKAGKDLPGSMKLDSAGPYSLLRAG